MGKRQIAELEDSKTRSDQGKPGISDDEIRGEPRGARS